MVDSLKHPRSDLAGQLNPGGGLAVTSPCCSRTAFAGCGAPPPLASPWLGLACAGELACAELELACAGEDDDVLKVTVQPASTGSSVSSAATISAGRPAARGAIRLCARIGASPHQFISQLSVLSAPTGNPLAEQLPGTLAGQQPVRRLGTLRTSPGASPATVAMLQGCGFS